MDSLTAAPNCGAPQGAGSAADASSLVRTKTGGSGRSLGIRSVYPTRFLSRPLGQICDQHAAVFELRRRYIGDKDAAMIHCVGKLELRRRLPQNIA
jgi:hypothetical protein